MTSRRPATPAAAHVDPQILTRDVVADPVGESARRSDRIGGVAQP
jgi:hypothetical protein